MSIRSNGWHLNELLSELNCSSDAHINGLSQDSRQVETGDLFVARRGLSKSGSEFVEQAKQQGARAVLLEGNDIEADELESRLQLPVVAWSKERLSLGELADRFYGSPSKKLTVIGITGTNGKTSSAHFTVQALNQLGVSAALIGTLGNGFLNNLDESSHTTPDVISLHSMLADYLQQGAKAVVMEVSSHAIDQQRISGVDFDVVAYTNLTRDHLDYHGSEAAYAEAKAKLFTDYGAARQVLNADDPRPAALLRANKVGVNRIGFSLTDQTQAVSLQKSHLSPEGMRLGIKLGSQIIDLKLSLLGEFNIANLLLVCAVLHQLGYSAEQVKPALGRLQPVNGRMERLPNADGPAVLVDYAHTPDALEKALAACRAHLSSGRLMLLFGCGGDRDRGKRPLMARAAEQGADSVWLTSDNPRTEDPAQITADTLAGFRNPQNVHCEWDRARAIGQIIESAGRSDLVLLAGKGHESYQEINGERLPFSDRLVAERALRAGGWL